MKILAPLRGVTIRAFRETFAPEIAAVGFTEALTPFIAAQRGLDPLKDRELKNVVPTSSFTLTPQFIGKDPLALRDSLLAIRAAGYRTADLNAGCPYPMVRNKGRGAGLLQHPDILEAMLKVGSEVMGEGNFSVKTRLGVERKDELLRLMPLFNDFPLRFLTVHARTARQMYEGACDLKAFNRILGIAKIPVVYNGDAPLDAADCPAKDVMIGRAFIRDLGARADASSLLRRYVEASAAELSGDRPVLCRMKELLSYWKDLPAWSRQWNLLKISRTLPEFLSVVAPLDV